MARPRKHKRICEQPVSRRFNAGKGKNGKISLSTDEYEVLRLIDCEKLTQQECARQMQVARSTVTSVYESARYKLSSAIVNDCRLDVGTDGDYELCKNRGTCCGHCGKSRCGHCHHGSCSNCIGIFRPPGTECYLF